MTIKKSWFGMNLKLSASYNRLLIICNLPTINGRMIRRNISALEKQAVIFRSYKMKTGLILALIAYGRAIQTGQGLRCREALGTAKVET